VTVKSWSWRAGIALGCICTACSCLALALAAGCGAQVTAGSQTAGGASVPASSSPAATTPAWPGPNGDLSTSIIVLRGALRAAFASGRDGEPMSMPPAPVIAALKRYFATADPAQFNGASRVAFIWAFSDVHASTATRQIVDAYFFADGEKMVAAGSIAPGVSIHLMSLSRPSPNGRWHVDGLLNE
jgi:hypothetical protein